MIAARAVVKFDEIEPSGATMEMKKHHRTSAHPPVRIHPSAILRGSTVPSFDCKGEEPNPVAQADRVIE